MSQAPRLYLSTLAAILMASSSALAQSVVITPSVTVTATRNPLLTFDYPGSVTVVGQEDLEKTQPSTAADVLSGVPNVTFSGGPRRTAEVPIIRGFSGQDVIILFDGTRQNFDSAHDGRFYLDPALLKQVEVVRGAASALYGSGGLGGVIEFCTKDASDFLAPGEMAGVSSFISYQSANEEWAPGVTLFAKPMEGLDLLGSAVYRNSGDIRTGGGEEIASDDEILSGLAKASYSLDAHRFELGWTRYDASAVEPNNGQDPLSTDFVDKELMAETWRGSYHFSEAGNQFLDLDANLYFTRYQADETRLVASSGGPVGELLQRDLNTLGFRLDNRSRFSLGEEAGVVLTYGFETYRDRQDGSEGGAERGGVPDAQSLFYGLYAQAEIAFAAPLGLPGEFLAIPGLRYDHYASSSDLADDNVEEAFSPKFALSYLPNDWLMVYGSYGHAFSAPNFNDVYAGGLHFDISSSFGFPAGAIANYFVPNPDLRPQTTRTFEAGLGINLKNIFEQDDSFTAKGGYFLTYADDLISLDVVQPLPVFIPGGTCFPWVPGSCLGTTTVVNVARARLQGVELEAKYDNALFSLAASFGHIDGIDLDKGEPIGSLQPDTVSVDMAGKFPGIDATLGWRVTFADEFTGSSDPTEHRDGYVLHDLYAVWRPQDELLAGLTVTLGIDNVTDETYSRVFTGANEAGRNFKAGLTYTLTW